MPICKICNRKFYSEKVFKRHQHYLLPKKDIQAVYCDFCHRDYVDGYKLKEHTWICLDCHNKIMPPLRRTDSPKNYQVINHVYELDEEIEILQNEINIMKAQIAKKYQRLNKLQTQKALRKQKEEIERRVRRETRFLVRKLSDDGDDETDQILNKSAEEHLAELLKDC